MTVQPDLFRGCGQLLQREVDPQKVFQSKAYVLVEPNADEGVGRQR